MEPCSEVAVIDGVRTPFIRSNGAFGDLASHDLGRLALQNLLKKTGLARETIELVVMGTVISDPRAPNLAREVLLGNSLPAQASAFTVSMACISSNMAVALAFDQMVLGRSRVAIAGGAETLSDFPIRHAKPVRQALIRLQKAKGLTDYLRELQRLSFRDLAPDVPTVTEFSTGLSMGQSCERLAKRIGVTRQEADAFALRSHQHAVMAWREGKYRDEVFPVTLPPHFRPTACDDGPRGDTSVESLARLKPSFDPQHGQITAGNASFLSDGGCCVLLMAKATALQSGFKPLAIIRDYVTRGTEPLDDLLLGPAFVIGRLLERHGLSVKEIDVWEIHEAFAAQMVANLKVMSSETLSSRILGTAACGEIPLDRLNVAGGSLALGHPFGATGARLVMTAARRLVAENGRFAVVSACAAGGHGLAMLLEHAEA